MVAVVVVIAIVVGVLLLLKQALHDLTDVMDEGQDDRKRKK
jgi:uncharacterized membrane protein (DUF4010 family)